MQAAKQRDAAKRKRERDEKAKEKKAAKKAKPAGSKGPKATPAKVAKVRRSSAWEYIQLRDAILTKVAATAAACPCH
jgi:hypothetical protein